MRLTNLLLVVFAILLLTAPAASFAQTLAPAAAPKSVSPFTGDPGAVIRPDGTPSVPPENASAWQKLNLMDSQPTCLKMRTYVVARDTPGSDSTHIASYHECLPSWKLEIRTSGQKEPAVETTGK